jgi:uncharacterized protein (TIGR02217 family)
MAVDFSDLIFPTDISFDSAGGPEFSTEINTLSGGAEKRNQNWIYPRERWNVAYGIKTQSLLQTLQAFFMIHRGMARGFRFKNHDDYTATGSFLGNGDGVETDFQMSKRYSYGGETYDRKIVKPVSGTVSIYIDSAVQGAGFTIDYTTGIVSFSSAPGSGEVVTADFEFHIAARFETDYLPTQLSTYQARSTTVPIVELKL